MCTTLSKEGNKSGNAECGQVDNITGEYIDGTVWHSCEEWCLSKVNTTNINYLLYLKKLLQHLRCLI